MKKESSFVKHARNELNIAGLFDKDSDYDGELGKAVMRLIETFDNEGHSGASAAMVSSIFNKLSNYGILTPLTEENSGWIEHKNKDGSISCIQNTRISSVFKDEKGTNYIDAITWCDVNGSTFHGTVEGISSSQYFDLPFVPKTFRIDVKDDSNGDSIIVDRKQLEPVFKYYNKRVIV
jgi:hypothetical protein